MVNCSPRLGPARSTPTPWWTSGRVYGGFLSPSLTLSTRLRLKDLNRKEASRYPPAPSTCPSPSPERKIQIKGEESSDRKVSSWRTARSSPPPPPVLDSSLSSTMTVNHLWRSTSQSRYHHFLPAIRSLGKITCGQTTRSAITFIVILPIIESDNDSKIVRQ